MNRQNTCGAMLKQLHDEMDKRANNSLRPQNLTLTQMQTMLILHDAPDCRLPLKDLETLLRVAQSTTAGIVSRLQKKGLIKMLEDPTDRRVKIAQLTEAGQECCLTADKHIAETEAQLLSGLTEAEQTILLMLLRKLRDNFC